ncbi:hypothetical protein HDU86_000943 [Geranomyces michiganensis]|nr:hypothetical protein HDU86_000943 [Geranomyces michiganensis]
MDPDSDSEDHEPENSDDREFIDDEMESEEEEDEGGTDNLRDAITEALVQVLASKPAATLALDPEATAATIRTEGADRDAAKERDAAAAILETERAERVAAEERAAGASAWTTEQTYWNV